MSLRMAAILSTLATFVRCVSTRENVFTMYVNFVRMIADRN